MQVAALVIGHVAGLTLAHDRAVAYWGDYRQATRSQYWMLACDGGLHLLRALPTLGLERISSRVLRGSTGESTWLTAAFYPTRCSLHLVY